MTLSDNSVTNKFDIGGPLNWGDESQRYSGAWRSS